MDLYNESIEEDSEEIVSVQSPDDRVAVLDGPLDKFFVKGSLADLTNSQARLSRKPALLRYATDC